MNADFGASTVLGYPRIGARRELKWALESYWDGRSTLDDLLATGAAIRAATRESLAGRQLASLPSNTFSYYDHVLDTAVLVDAVPDRYRHLSTMDAYFAMARGTADLAPLRMTKWFNTNYHYIVPEIGPDTAFRLVADQPLREVREAPGSRPVLVGPVTFLLLSQAEPGSPAGWRPLDRLDDVVAVYAELLSILDVPWVQLDEPALVADRSAVELDAVRRAYATLGSLSSRPRLFVASYFGELGDALPALTETPVEAIGLDLVHGALPGDLTPLRGKTVVAGLVSGRNVWRTDSERALSLLWTLRDAVDDVAVSTAGSLLHVPHRLEPGIDPAVFAFAEEKVAEVVALASAPRPHLPALPPVQHPGLELPAASRAPYPVRAPAQAAHLQLPALPVTAIGSFPQTDELRAARAGVAAGRVSTEEYERAVAAEIERVIRLQERLGLDVLVHGEPERNDMVQYFAERLDGFTVTRDGWVQSYGSRCTRPPILHGTVRRREPMTVRWATYAQSLTDRPVKGMLTGPVTIVAWSFVRTDLPLFEVTWQVAAAVREEVGDLAAAGVSIIQVDEPALRELLPLRERDQGTYLDWAVGAYRYATSGVDDRVQIHTHLCYSDADEILAAIDALDADVTTVESARSGGRILREVASFQRGLGPGVYDIHSPRVPSVDEVGGLLRDALAVLPAGRLWVNPDCGLKTRTYPQVEAALSNVVAAARSLRS